MTYISGVDWPQEHLHQHFAFLGFRNISLDDVQPLKLRQFGEFSDLNLRLLLRSRRHDERQGTAR